MVKEDFVSVRGGEGPVPPAAGELKKGVASMSFVRSGMASEICTHSREELKIKKELKQSHVFCRQLQEVLHHMSQHGDECSTPGG